jgi:UDP:flavonoid glycosyltransferase YjiC (YdhE family)
MSAGSFLICSWAGGGNTTPAIYLGQRLRQRGHRVRLLGWDSMAERVTAAGLEFASYPSVPSWPVGVPLDDEWDRMVEAVAGEGTTADILAVADADMPDVLIVDCMLKAGLLAAAQLPVRTAVLVHVLYHPFVYDWGNEALEFDLGEAYARADQVLAALPAVFDTPGPLPVNTHYVGAIPAPVLHNGVPPLEVLATPGDPWVLLSMGSTLQRQDKALPVILDALATMPVRVLLTLGGVLTPDQVVVPANVMTVGFVQHETVLPYVDMVVSHGGLSTITTALSYGRPLVCIPQGRDQPDNARHMEASGAGRVLEIDATAAEIKACVEAVLNSSEMHAAAGRFADPEAGEEAARLVEQLLPQHAMTA